MLVDAAPYIFDILQHATYAVRCLTS